MFSRQLHQRNGTQPNQPEVRDLRPVMSGRKTSKFFDQWRTLMAFRTGRIRSGTSDFSIVKVLVSRMMLPVHRMLSSDSLAH